jgi:hypothetical protein
MEVQFRASNGQIHDGILSAQRSSWKASLPDQHLPRHHRTQSRRARPEGQPGTPRPGAGLGAAGHLGLAHSQRHALRLGPRRPAARPAAEPFMNPSMRFSKGCPEKSATTCATPTAACAKARPATIN